MGCMRLLSAAGVLAAAVSAGELADKYNKKLEKTFVAKVPWELDWAKAKAKAKAQNKPIFAFFTRSYAP